jgi:uncharacterized protein (TIGR02677 family)
VSGAGFDPFSHLTAPNVALYRQIMSAFASAKQRFVVHLRPEDVCEALAGSQPRVDPDAVADALRPLVQWGNLRDDPDTSRVTTIEDFHRPRFLYQLTSEGEAVERALAAYDEHLGRRGSLQAVALADIAAQLRALHELARQSDPDSVRVSLLLRDLVGRFTDLADNAQAFMGSLQRTIDLYDADVETFRAYKDRLVEYLERFIKDLVTVGAEIAALLDALERTDVARLLAIAAARDARTPHPARWPRTAPPIRARPRTKRASLRGRAAGEDCDNGSSPTPGIRARPSSCAHGRGRRSRSCWRSSPRSTSAAPVAPTVRRTSARSRAGSRRRPTRSRCIGCGASRSASAARATWSSTAIRSKPARSTRSRLPRPGRTLRP